MLHFLIQQQQPANILCKVDAVQQLLRHNATAAVLLQSSLTAALLYLLVHHLSIRGDINGSHLATVVSLPRLHAALADLYVVMRDLQPHENQALQLPGALLVMA